MHWDFNTRTIDSTMLLFIMYFMYACQYIAEIFSHGKQCTSLEVNSIVQIPRPLYRLSVSTSSRECTTPEGFPVRLTVRSDTTTWRRPWCNSKRFLKKDCHDIHGGIYLLSLTVWYRSYRKSGSPVPRMSVPRR